MTLFRVEGKGVIQKVKIINDTRVVEIPKDWDSKYVRLYKLRILDIVK